MRILVLSNISPYRIGGAEVQARQLAECFHRRGHKVAIAGYAVPSGRIRVPGYGAIDTIHLPTLRGTRLSRAVTFFFSLAGFLIIRGRHFDLIYCRMIGESAIVAAILKQLKLLDLPLVVSSECSGAAGDAAFLKSLPACASIVRWLNRQCQAINVLSPEIGMELRSLGLDPGLFSFIPNGVRIPADRPMVSADREMCGLFVGRLVPVKGVGDLLRAVRILQNRGIAARVRIVGQGPLGDVLRDFSRALGIDALITFHGMSPPEKVSDFYQSSAYLILPSYSEGFSLVAAEAMSFGLPLIVTRSGGPEHFVDDRVGFVCPAGDPHALADAMAMMLRRSPPQLAQMGECAQQRIRREYDIEQVSNRLLSLFGHLLLDMNT